MAAERGRQALSRQTYRAERKPSTTALRSISTEGQPGETRAAAFAAFAPEASSFESFRQPLSRHAVSNSTDHRGCDEPDSTPRILMGLSSETLIVMDQWEDGTDVRLEERRRKREASATSRSAAKETVSPEPVQPHPS